VVEVAAQELKAQTEGQQVKGVMVAQGLQVQLVVQ
jgi:hypothetical protein